MKKSSPILVFAATSALLAIVKDDQIKGLAKKGKLTLKMSGIHLNCPIIKVGHGGT